MKSYLAEMLYKLTSAYSRKDYDNYQQGLPMQTNIGKLFSIFAWGLDQVQEQAELIKLWDDLENAKGRVLDRYGANWGVKRFSENDALYRLAIRVKVMSQLSGGDTDTVIRAAADLLGVEDSDILFGDVFPAKIALYVDWLLLTQERQELIEPIAYAIKRIIAAGVGFRLYIRTYRTYRYDLNISRGGVIGAYITALPVSRDRELEQEWAINFGGYDGASFAPPIVGKDRDGTSEWPVSFGGFTGSAAAPPPIGMDRSDRDSIRMALSTFMEQALQGAPPDVKRPVTGSHKGAGGTLYRTHIKPKRID